MIDETIVNNKRLVLDLLNYCELIRDKSFLFLKKIFINPLIPLNMNLFYRPCISLVLAISFAKLSELYTKNGNCSINLKSGPSPRFNVFRGVHQGCPVSPYLFLIAAQLLTSSLLNSQLQGINIADKLHKTQLHHITLLKKTKKTDRYRS